MTIADVVAWSVFVLGIAVWALELFVWQKRS